MAQFEKLDKEERYAHEWQCQACKGTFMFDGGHSVGPKACPCCGEKAGAT